ncbi:MAG: hypothetical protein V4675_25120 [Verrucomicrobiota bacterium]
MPRYLSFYTDHTLGNNGFAGRVCGGDIRVGDRFTAEYRSEHHKDEDEAWSELFFTKPIDLKVSRIEAYGRGFEEISSGMTCLLEFEGDISNIAPRALIGDEHTRECHEEELERSRRRHTTSEQAAPSNGG